MAVSVSGWYNIDDSEDESALIADHVESSTEHRILMRYALDSKLSPEEVLFQDVEKGMIWRRKHLRRFVRNSEVTYPESDQYIDHINKRSLKASDGYFKKFIFRTTFAAIEIRGDDIRKNDDGNPYWTIYRVIYHLLEFKYLPEGIDANKCELWCIPISYEAHATAVVINIKEACFEYLDSGPCSSRETFSTVEMLCRRVCNYVTEYINSQRRLAGYDAIDFSEFTWRFPAVPRQPLGSYACAIYRLRFLEEWGGGGMDLRRFEGWGKRYWHIQERVKMCASVLSQDCNVIADDVKRKAQQWQTAEEP